MKTRAIAATAIALGLALTGCTGSPEPTPTPEPTRTSAPATPTPSSKPSKPAPQITIPPAEPIVDVEPDHAPEITRTQAYELCKAKVFEDMPSPYDPRNTYASFEDSYVEAINGQWRVWIPGVEHPDGVPANIALTCVLNGYIDNPSFYGWGGVATYYYSDIDAYFAEFLTPYAD